MCSQLHKKFLPFLSLHAIVCTVIIGNLLNAFSFFPLHAEVFFAVLFVQSHFFIALFHDSMMKAFHYCFYRNLILALAS